MWKRVFAEVGSGGYAPSSPRTLLMCHNCLFVLDDGEAGSEWVTKEAYRRANGIDHITCRLTALHVTHSAWVTLHKANSVAQWRRG